MMLDRFTQHTVDPLALMSNVSHQQYYSQSSTTLRSTHVQPYFAENNQLDSGLSPTDNLIENLTNTLAILTQSYKTYLPQTNNQLRTSSNTRNQATVQLVMGELTTELGMQIQVKQGRLSGQDNVVDEDVDEQPVQDLALNVDNMFQADDCDAFDSDVNEAPTARLNIESIHVSGLGLSMLETKPDDIEELLRGASVISVSLPSRLTFTSLYNSFASSSSFVSYSSSSSSLTFAHESDFIHVLIH
ncbi:hypothetical protein Tco_1294771 [Tanacetum coccineum]